ncbi:MAG: glycoside hydrolase family 88 protein [Flavobacteriia bacterium]|nr:glycoside hydrolase family 88 protein [Flavobacteriia bacterium]NCT59660.1 glycoside hydrolase family 88 protein [Flavobacteriia bacterium]
MKKLIYNSLIIIVFANCAVSNKTVAQNLDENDIKKSMISALEWQEAHPIFAASPTDWTAGAYYIGVARAHKSTKDQIFEAALKNQGYHNNWMPFNRAYHADDVAISYSYLYIDMNLGRNNFVNLKPTKDFLDTHLYKTTKWNNPANTDKIENILWWWCDALFMAPPVISLYAKHTKEMKYLDDMHKFYLETYNQLFDKEERLFARDLRFVWTGSEKDKKEPNGKKIFWSRGNGWVLGGLALLLDDMPKDYKHRAFYENLFKQMAGRILELQPKDGLWRTSLLSPETYNHGEVSGSGFYTFALAWGVNNGLLENSKYVSAIKKAWKALVACQHENGMVGWVQNIGAFPEPASYDSWQNFGTGAYLLAGSEVLKLVE